MTYWDNAPWEPRKWQKEAVPLIIDAIKSGNKRPVVSAIMGAGKSITISELVYQASKNLNQTRKIVICAPSKDLVNQLSGTIGVRCGKENVGRFFSDEKNIDPKIIVTTFVSAGKLALLLKDKSFSVAMVIGDEIHGTESDNFIDAFNLLDPACAVGFTATPYRSDDKETLSLWGDVAYRYTAKQALEDGVIVHWKLVHWDGQGSDHIDDVCLNMIKKMPGQGIVNAIDIQDANAYSMFLDRNGIPSGVIHSMMDQEHKDATMRCLKSGEIKCVVHVSMLTEGVDIPWLNWIVLRRPVGARVRFVQEVGRVLRSYPGKTHAVIGDPYNLFGKFSLSNPEQLGERRSEEEIEYDEILIDLEPEPEKRAVLRQMPPAIAFSHIDSYIISLLAVLRTAEVCPPKNVELDDTGWRGCSPTRKQCETIVKMKNFARYMPKEIRESFYLLIENVKSYNRGTASDMLEILFGLAKGSEKARKDPNPYKKHWKMPKIDYPVPDFPIQQMIFVMERN